MIFDSNKKGTIIVSHYRSGGTQLMQTLWLSIGEKYTTNLNEYNPKVDGDICEYLESAEKYRLLLINDSEAITELNNMGTFDKLKEDYIIVVLERKNKVNCLLSMALWERFIATGYFKTGQKSWTDEVMLEFHKQCKKDLMKPNDVTVNREIPKGEHTPDQVLEYTLKTFVDEVNQLRDIIDKYGFFTLYYEDFEYDNEYLAKLITPKGSIHSSRESRTKLSCKSMNKKIPYISKDYLVYYVSEVTDAVKRWKINEL
jgi:hypothetical protein|tara:strand:- start:238 stop:1008 length:771 start_codon:yes stop_codon:yes gene_type:complete